MMTTYYWSKSTTSTAAAATHTRHLFQHGDARRAVCGRQSRPVGDHETAPPEEMTCQRCRRAQVQHLLEVAAVDSDEQSPTCPNCSSTHIVKQEQPKYAFAYFCPRCKHLFDTPVCDHADDTLRARPRQG